MSRTILVTVSDDRFGRKDGAYKQTQYKIAHILISHNPNFGVELLQWDWTKIQHSDFYKAPKIKTLLDNQDPARNGRAYKPLVIQHELHKLAFGDYLIYNDCSPELWPMPDNYEIPGKYNLAVLHDLVRINGGILSAFVKWDKQTPITNGLGIHTHDNFTTDRCIKRMDAENHRYDYQHASGFIAIRKTEETVEFVREWVHFNCIDECAGMGRAEVADDYSFWDAEELHKMGHRHDQSISGILINKRGGNLIDLPAYEGINPYNFLQYCRRDVEYQFISSNNKHIPGPNEIKKGSTVKNANGQILTVFEFAQYGEVVVGKHRQSCYKTKVDKLILVKQ